MGGGTLIDLFEEQCILEGGVLLNSICFVIEKEKIREGCYI